MRALFGRTGAWCFVNGAWRTTHGTWHPVHACTFACIVWCMMHDAWRSVHGAWCMVHGIWRSVHGAWCMAHGAQCMVHGTWQTGQRYGRVRCMQAFTRLPACLCVHVYTALILSACTHSQSYSMVCQAYANLPLGAKSVHMETATCYHTHPFRQMRALIGGSKCVRMSQVAAAIVFAETGALPWMRCGGFVLAAVLIIAWLNLRCGRMHGKARPCSMCA
eukprot:364896-Chlamydomonas_euryale.AAC.10